MGGMPAGRHAWSSGVACKHIKTAVQHQESLESVRVSAALEIANNSGRMVMKTNYTKTLHIGFVWVFNEDWFSHTS